MVLGIALQHITCIVIWLVHDFVT